MDDWKPGDLALCVREGKWTAHGIGLRAGQVHEVVEVLTPEMVDIISNVSRSAVFLGFAPWLPRNVFGSRFFTKINPLTEDEEREARREIEQDKHVHITVLRPDEAEIAPGVY